jgi:hypothetical protein
MSKDNGQDDFIDLSAIAGEISRRGRKSEVDPEVVDRLKSCEPGKGFFFPGSDMSGSEYDTYIKDKSSRRPKADGAMETADEAMRRAVNAWQQRQRQRAQAVAQAAGVDPVVLQWHNSGRLVIGRPKG